MNGRAALVAVLLTRRHPIVIPQVGPGIYRIADEIIVEGEAVPGFVIVEVADDFERA